MQLFSQIKFIICYKLNFFGKEFVKLTFYAEIVFVLYHFAKGQHF